MADPPPLAVGVHAVGPVITPEGDKLPSGGPAFVDADASRSEVDTDTLDASRP